MEPTGRTSEVRRRRIRRAKRRVAPPSAERDRFILVTGGAGYVGSHAAKALGRAGFHPILLDNLSTGHMELVHWGTFEKGDVGDELRVKILFARYPIFAVMHFAAHAYVGESVVDPGRYYLNNVGKTMVLLEAMRASGVKRIIFSSSCAVYGNPLSLPLKEDHPQNPVSPYGKSKQMVEEIIEDYCRAYEFRAVCLRYFNASGADLEGETGELHDPETHLIPLALRAGTQGGGKLKIFGADYPTADGTCVRDYVHVSDVASAHMLALDYLEKGGESTAFNLGNGTGVSVRQVIQGVEKVRGESIPQVIAERRPGDPPILISDSTKVRQVLGWEPAIPDLETIITSAWAWEQKRRTPDVLRGDTRRLPIRPA